MAQRVLARSYHKQKTRKVLEKLAQIRPALIFLKLEVGWRAQEGPFGRPRWKLSEIVVVFCLLWRDSLLSITSGIAPL